MDYEQKVFNSLESVLAPGIDTQEMRATAAGFLITGELMERPISALSEGQKGPFVVCTFSFAATWSVGFG